MELPPLPAEAQAAIRALVPFAGPRNPVDSTAQIANDRTLLSRMLRIMLKAGRFDVLIAFLGFTGEHPARIAELMPDLEALRAAHPRTLFVLSMRCSRALRAELLDKGFATVEEPADAMRVASALAWLGERTAPTEPADIPAGAPLPPGDLDEAGARRVLAEAGIPFVPARVARTADEAADAAAALGFPVAMKVLSPDIAHKSDVGGVRLGVRDATEAAAAYGAMLAEVRAEAPAARVTGALLSPMVTGGVETVLGVVRDPVFGPLVMFGLGGVFVEAFRDVAFRLAPVDRAGAVSMLRSIKGSALLRGVRGRPAVDEDALADALVALSRFAVAQENGVESAEINPFLALPRGGVGLDAVVVRRTA
jgi:acyl-CoA synthetase (NDP forming)